MRSVTTEVSTRMPSTKAVRWLVVFAAILFFATSAPCAISDYAGTYSGSYIGDDTGLWIALVQSDGDVAFISWSNSAYETDGTDSLTINDSGYISGGTDNGGYVEITVDPSGTVSGTWTGGGGNGTLSGDKCDNATMSSLAGTYTGSISGDASGSFSFTLYSSGHVTGSVIAEGDTTSIKGGVDDAGNIILDASGEAAIKGTASSNGSISGHWYSYDGAEGTFSGSKTSGDTSGSDDGSSSSSSGPCFIQMIAD